MLSRETTVKGENMPGLTTWDDELQLNVTKTHVRRILFFQGVDGRLTLSTIGHTHYHSRNPDTPMGKGDPPARARFKYHCVFRMAVRPRFNLLDYSKKTQARRQ
jgi:hypothetical protein